MPDFITRWAMTGFLILAGIATGAVLGARYELARWEAADIKDSLITEKTKATQTINTQRIDHETSRLISRSDEYWRVRQQSLPAGLPGTTGQPDATTPADSSDPAGRIAGIECSPAAGAADAIVIIEWQRWAKEMQAATAGQ